MAKPAKRIIDQDRMLEVGNEIIAAIANNDLKMVCDGPVTTAVKFADGAYRKKVIGNGWDFFMDSCYINASSNLIFVLSTHDQPAFDEFGHPAKIWEFAEFGPDALDSAFPLLLPDLSKFIDTKDSMAKTIEHLYNRKTVAANMEEDESQNRLRDLPTFGMF